ncbi:50S ribosomal protein L6 [Candidatus Pacearchaeota archaeon]|nr:50S ribosomal protein L6 [Candidatus Pacearchaeota archaeon]
MKTEMKIPQGTTCEYSEGILKCKKRDIELTRKLSIPGIDVKVDGEKISIECRKGNKKHHNMISTTKAHIKNLFHGLEKKFTYKLEICHIHFPISIKIEKEKFLISNFLGEKKIRTAEILPNVEVEIKGQNITLSSLYKEAAGQTAANLEKATKIKKRDRRIYQDGIFIVEKPRRENEA